MKHLFSRQRGFTLAELLIALAILGVIATFTIPKVLTSSTDSQSKAVAKEVAGMISGAYTTYQIDASVATSTPVSAFSNSMNYVKVVSVTADNPMNGGAAAFDCTQAGLTCLLLHSGAVIGYKTAQTFGATANYIQYNIDPDGTKSALGPASFVLYYNGRLTTGQNATGTLGGGGSGTLTLVTTDPSFAQF